MEDILGSFVNPKLRNQWKSNLESLETKKFLLLLQQTILLNKNFTREFVLELTTMNIDEFCDKLKESIIKEDLLDKILDETLDEMTQEFVHYKKSPDPKELPIPKFFHNK